MSKAKSRADSIWPRRERERSGKLERNNERLNSAKAGKKGQGKAAKKTDAPVITSDKAVFGGNDLVTLVWLIVDKPPYLEPHGSKGAAWDEIAQRHVWTLLCSKGFKYHVAGQAFQNKVAVLLKYKKALDNSLCKAITSALSGSSAGIIISALLEELEHIVEKAKAKAHKAIQQKLEEDCIGGDALQTASMNSLCKLSVDDEDGNGDTEDDGIADDDEAQCITLTSTSLGLSSNLVAHQTTGTVTPITHTSSISSTDADGASTQPSVVTKTTTVTGHAEKRQADASPSEEPKPKRYRESARCPAPKLAAKSST
ncbi:hypothetical protein L208DRAFT_1382072 [Tricholoma matsutake]|nr:hypothetical protein L208DRAFT_1382072 [Tricholoma matsutake 945]